jgi:hypothetical protein
VETSAKVLKNKMIMKIKNWGLKIRMFLLHLTTNENAALYLHLLWAAVFP